MNICYNRLLLKHLFLMCLLKVFNVNERQANAFSLNEDAFELPCIIRTCLKLVAFSL
jgi:hypothetical protein